MAATGKVIGTVSSVVGEAKATAADGTVRVLQVGDLVYSDEVITTDAAGSVNIALQNGKTLDCGGDTDLALHESILGVATAATTPATTDATPGTPPTGDVAALQAAIASGQDPTQVAPATAAGGAPAAGGAADGGGGTPVVIEQANSGGVVTSGFPTAGDSIGFPAPEFNLLPIQPVPPAISVQVTIGVVNVSVGEGGTDGEVVFIPASTQIPAAGVSAINIPEGSGGGTHPVSFLITLDQVSEDPVTITYTIVPGTASNPGDFHDGVAQKTVTIPAGFIGFVVTENIVEDKTVEGNENFTIVLSDPIGVTISNDTATVTIIDDDTAPVAHADTNWTQEDLHVVASGNVIAGQSHPGAPSGAFADVQDTDADGDIPQVTTAGTFVGNYGTLVLNADGSYSYTLNNGSTAVQSLNGGETLTDSFSYTASDGVNTPSSSTLTVTIFGSNDVPEIKVKTGGEIFASSAEGTVEEAALANGSNPSSNAEFVNGSFQISDTDGLDDIASVTMNGQTVAIGNLVGAVFHGSAGDLTVTSYTNGVATFTYELKHAVTDVANQAETDVFTLTTSDGTSNSAPATVTITIIDDVPSTNVAATPATGALTVDETDLGTNATVNFAADFSGGSSFGADGPGTVSNAIYTLSINAGSTGLVDTATGQNVVLSMNGGAVEGRTASSGEVVFRVSVDASGNVTLDQQRAVMHTPDSGPDQSTSLASANLVVLTRAATITDADGDTANASASINIGQALNFKDDAPSVNVSAIQTADTLTVDETSLATNATANFADNFSSSSSFGTDGAGSLSTAYSLSIGSTNSGLVDTASGEAVTLQMSGGNVQGVISGGVVVFEVSVNSGGQVTFDQQRAVMHTPDSGPDQSTSLAANLIVLTRTDTITDKDGDTSNSSANIDLSTALTLKDDAPSVNVSRTDVSADSLTVDETDLATNASANYADNFSSSSSFGADGAGTAGTSYSLSIGAGSTGLVDTATQQAVTLQISGGKVQGVISGNVVVFEVSVDSNGQVTLDQQRAVMHTPDSGPDQSTSLASADLVVLTRTDTITDKDGDSASSSSSISIGTSLHFEDDAPSLNITGGDTSVIEGQSISNGTWTSATGADAPATTKVVIGETEYNLDSAIDTGKGTLTVNSNGTWTFAAAPNQSNPQTVTFSVKITDKDGDVASDSRTITINDGADPGVSGGQVLTVNEAALSIGTNPSSTAENDSTTLTFTSGSDTITSMVFGSTAGITVNTGLDETQSITWAVSNGGRTLIGSIGDTAVIQLDLTGATSVAAGGNTGNVTVTATLLDNMLHQNSPDADSLVISGVKVIGTDSDGDMATQTFTGITVLDDAPTLSATSLEIDRTAGHTLGTYSFAVGADQASFSTSFPTGSLVWTNKFSGYDFTFSGGKYIATFDDNGVTKTFFEMTVNSNGTYDFNLVTPAPDTVESSGPLFSGITGGSNLPSFTFDASNFGGAFSLVLTATDNKAGADTITISATELGINGNSIQEQFDETLKLDVMQQPGFENATVTRLLIGIADTGSLKTGDDFAITVTYKTGSPTTVTDSYDGSGVLDFNIDSSRVVDFVTFHAISNNVNFKVTGITLEYDSNLNPPDQLLNFNLTGSDADGDTATAGFSVNVIAGTSANDTLFTGNAAETVSGGAGDDSISTAGGNDILIGGAGHDTLIGGSGSDTYVFEGPLTAATSDTIVGFTYAPASSGGDVLDLHDVLPVAAQGITDPTALGSYVKLATDGSGNTVISIDADAGGPGAAVQVVTLQGVTGVTLQQLLANQEVHT